jgi:hypothetical protein
MLKWLSPCLLKAKVRSFELSGFSITVEHCRLARRVMHPLTLLEAREHDVQLPSSCIGPTAVRERSLEAIIAAGEALFAKLFDLPHRHPLLVLRQCLQQNLRHLQCSLRSDNLEHLWERLDDSLANSVLGNCGAAPARAGPRRRAHLHRSSSQTRRSGDPILQDMHPSPVRGRPLGFRHPL